MPSDLANDFQKEASDRPIMFNFWLRQNQGPGMLKSVLDALSTIQEQEGVDLRQKRNEIQTLLSTPHVNEGKCLVLNEYCVQSCYN